MGWLLLGMSLLASAKADIAPPQPISTPCDLRRCPGQEGQWCGQGEGVEPSCALSAAEGWTEVCDRRVHTLFCRDISALPEESALPPELVALLSGAASSRARLKAPPKLRWSGSGTPATVDEQQEEWREPLPAWQRPDARIQVAVALDGAPEGRLLLDVHAEDLEPVQREPLPLFDRPDGDSIGSLVGIGATVSMIPDEPSPEGWHRVRLPEGLPLSEAWTNVIPRSGPLYPSPPERPEVESVSGCVLPGTPLAARPAGEPLATAPAGDCRLEWAREEGAAESQGWVQVRHRTSGLLLWAPVGNLLHQDSMDLGGFGLGGGGGSGGGLGSGDTWHAVEAPQWLYSVPGGEVIGRLERGQVQVELAQEGGWWATTLGSPAGSRQVWLGPPRTDEEEAPVATAPAAASEPVPQQSAGCAAVPSAGWAGVGGLLVGLARRRQRRP